MSLYCLHFLVKADVHTGLQLLTADPPLPLPPNNKRRANGAWAMIDAGDFAVHILSKEAREKYFPDRRDW